MELTINTTQLQSMVAKSVKGASCNKMIPMTSMLAIEKKDGFITLITTDANNYLIVRTEALTRADDEFYAVVPVVLFSQLVARLTCETVTLKFEDGQFTVFGNGSYKIELPLDENGDFIKLPAPYKEMLADKYDSEISIESVKRILKANKAALATTLEVPCYTGYYVADRVISTDTYKLCGNNISVTDTPMLVAPETMLLLDVMTQPTIYIIRKDNKILFSTADCIVYGNLMSDIENYQVEAISQLLDDSFDNSCEINNNALLEAIDRVGLFVGQYDNNSVNLHFTADSIEISSPQAYGSELVEYEKHDGAEFSCDVNIDMLVSQLKAQTDDIITIEYGKENTIKIVSEDVVQVIALDA